jgi:RNA 3'-terminal phosphate cyclase
MRDAAMTAGESSFTVREVSSHAGTAMWLIEQFLPARFAAVEQGALTSINTVPRQGGKLPAS